MNTNKQTEKNANTNPTAASFYLASCRRILSEVQRVKQALMAEFRGAVQVPAHLLELALNEAEALAVQTGFPQLLFPTLAIEKAQDLVARHQRQQAIWRGHRAVEATA